MIQTLGDALPEEITRVRKIQDQYKTLLGMPDVMVEVPILLIEHEIQQAIHACATRDVVEMIRCYIALKAYD